MDREPLIRPARQDDLPALTGIYNHYVCNSVATFDTQPFTPVERQQWLDQFADKGRHRLFVAEGQGGVCGYSSSSMLRPKPAYCVSVETSIYLLPEMGNKGLGHRLYQTLFNALASEDLHRAYAVIALPNDAAHALHRRHGFTPLYTLHEVGRKFDRYVSTQWFEKKLN